jgi:hypothetical protein
MTSTVMIPAGGIADTREALLCLLNRPVEGIAHTLTVPERELHPEWFEGDRRDFNEVCRLLDLIGWDAGAPARKVEVTSEDAHTIRGAIEDYLPLVEQWLCEAQALRTRRQHRDSVQAMWTLLAALREVAPDDEKAA